MTVPVAAAAAAAASLQAEPSMLNDKPSLFFTTKLTVKNEMQANQVGEQRKHSLWCSEGFFCTFYWEVTFVAPVCW